MSKILLMGHKPPQLMGQAKIEASHYRTWQFLEPLLADGHQICLCANGTNSSHTALPKNWGKQLTCHVLPLNRQMGWIRQAQKIHDSFQPDCIVAVNFDCCLSATRLRTDKPIWMDIYGDHLTIMQVARYRAGSDRGIPTGIKLFQPVLKRGDRYSACGTPQAHALVGELGMAGRLNSRTFGYQFTYVILPGAPPTNQSYEPAANRGGVLRAQGVPPDSFVVLWCGGYNTWTDVETLFAGLEWAMQKNAKIHYVSVGANTYEAPDNVYLRFLRMIEQSPYRDHFHMLGWRPWTEVSDYYCESDAGLNIDALHYETIYGTRTRLVEMLAAGLPVITSLGCELSDLISNFGAGLTFESGDSQGMGRQILRLANDKELHSKMAKTAFSYASHDLSFANTTAPVRTWVREPQLAPDNTHTGGREKLHQLEYQARSIIRQVIWQVAGLDK